MGKIRTVQNNFTGGELTPFLKGRTDVAAYQHGLETGLNALVLVTGGTTRRPGLRFIDSEGTITSKIVPFNILVGDVLQGYVIEFRSDNATHFYKNGARIGTYSITHPFPSSALSKIRYEQFNNILYLVHPNYKPQQLVRTNDTSWAFSDIAFDGNYTVNTEDQLAVSGITRSGSTATVVTGTISGTTTSQTTDWSQAQTVTDDGGISYTTQSEPIYTENTVVNYSGAAHGYVTGQSVRISGATQPEYNGDFVVTVVDDTTFTYTVSGAPVTPATGTIKAQGIVGITRSSTTATVFTPSLHPFNDGDIARIAGCVQTPYNGDFTVTKISDNSFSYTVSGSPATPATGTITVQKVHWNATTGYPSVITFFEQRMILGATAAKGTTIWGSESGVITNFITGALDSDPFEFKLAAADTNIVNLSALKMIFACTATKIISIYGGTDKPLTPLNFQIKVQSFYGTNTVPPIIIGMELVFASKYGKKIRTLIYDVLSESFKAAPISTASSHLLEQGVVAMARSTEPANMLWLVTTDGTLVTVLFDRDQQVVAWMKTTTTGVFKDVVVVATTGTDQVWFNIQRTVNGSTNTHIEMFDTALNTDAAITGTDATGKTTWTGLSHLEGETVDIIADGCVMPQQTVSGGQVVLPRAAKTVEIGLHYGTTLKDLPPDMLGLGVSVNKVAVRLYNTQGCTINGDVVPFRQYGTGMLDTYVAPFTGDKFVSNLGWSERGQVTIEQTQPLPMTVLSISKEVTVNG